VARLSLQAAPIAPVITTQPTNQTATPCDTAQFVVEASSTIPMAYQWFFNATNVLANATNPIYSVVEPRPANAGEYRVVVSNTGGSVTSDVATLTVELGDCDGDGMSDAWELANGLDPADPGDRDLDADNDGRTNLQEAISGTDPQDPDSVLSVTLQRGPGGSALIQFQASAGISYSVLYRPLLTSGSWLSLTNIPALDSTQILQIVDPNAQASGSRFYRIQTPMQP